ncbi:MAG: DNA translocase FtsK [Pseudomonadota bacterium]
MSRNWLPDTIQKQLRQFAKQATYLIFIGGLFYISVYGTYTYSTAAPSYFGASDFGVARALTSIFEWGLTFFGWSFPVFVFLHGVSWALYLFRNVPLFSKNYTLLYILIFQSQLFLDALAHAVHYPIHAEGIIPFLGIYPLMQLMGDSLLGWLLVSGAIFVHMLYVVNMIYPIQFGVNNATEEQEEMHEEASLSAGPQIHMPKRREATVPQATMATVSATSQKFVLPPVTLLSQPTRKGDRTNAAALQDMAKKLQQVLLEFGVKGIMGAIHPGPVVTLYEFEPAPGIKSARVIGLSSDIARSMGVLSTRIAVVPGQNMMGIEIPNKTRETVFLRELIENQTFIKDPGQLTLALGQDIQGIPVMVDLASMPHLLVAGTTGSGKSVSVNAMILSLLYRLKPEQCRMVMIDPKMLELSVYDGIPHLITPVVTDPKKAVQALKWAVSEMEQRYSRMSKMGVRNLSGYNERIRQAQSKGEILSHRQQTGFDEESGHPIYENQTFAYEILPYIVVIVDEMADLMMVAGKEIEICVQRLAQMARAAGIHLIMATQRPSVDVITGTIKANFPTRISFHVTSKIDSRTILGEQGAEQLLGQGDMLYMKSGGRIFRVHGPFVSDQEVEKIVQHLRTQERPDQDIRIDLSGSADSDAEFEGGGDDADEALLQQAIGVMQQQGKISTSLIQRHLRIGYNKAARLVEMMEARGLVSPADHTGRRNIIGR